VRDVFTVKVDYTNLKKNETFFKKTKFISINSDVTSPTTFTKEKSSSLALRYLYRKDHALMFK